MPERDALIGAAVQGIAWALIEDDTDTTDRGVSAEHYAQRAADARTILVDIQITDAMVEGMARMLHARTAEGRSGFSWPLNGDWGRARDLENARRALTYVLTFVSVCPSCGVTATTLSPSPTHHEYCTVRAAGGGE